MKALENPMAAEALVREAQEYGEQAHPREEGVHVSDIIACRRKGWYRMQGVEVAPHSTQTLLLFLMGQGHHSFLEAGNAEVSLEVTYGGIRITGTVDRMEEDAEGEYPSEIKTTRASYRKMVDPSEHYVAQAASYAVMKGTNHARIYVIFLLGDYTKAKLPKIRAWDIYFTERELADWRKEMERRAKLIAGPTLPSLNEHAPWECNYCPFNAAVGGVCEAGGGNEYQWFPVQQQDLRDLLKGGSDD